MTDPRSSIRRRLMWAIMGTSLAVLVLTCAAFIVHEIITIRTALPRGLMTRAEILAANSTAALAFQNEADARAVLAALRRDPRTVAACIYDTTGRVFATYPADAPPSRFPAQPMRSGSHFTPSSVTVFAPVMEGDRWLGTVYLESNLDALTERLRAYAVLVAIVLACAILLAFVLSIWLQKRLSQPLLTLAATAREVSERRDYSLRPPAAGDDEIGQLTDSFTEMLDEIQARDTALRTSEARLRAILVSALDAIVTFDRDGHIVEFNPAAEKMCGHQRATAVGASVIDLLVPEAARPGARAALADYLASGRSDLELRTELSVLCASGDEVPVEVAIVQVRREGAPIFTAFARDISERRRAERAIRSLNAELEKRVVVRTAELETANRDLETANRELEAFSYSVSHDLRAPLRTIDGFSKAILDEYAPKLDDAGRGYLSLVRGAIHHMGQLIDDMLDLARVSRTEMRRQSVDLTAIGIQIAATLQQAQPERRVSVRVAHGLHVQGDEQLLRVVIDNLLRNAWKFTSKHATASIEMGCEVQGGRAVYFVRDDGAGFDMAHASQLFKPFHRLHLQQEFEGTGIGLATVARIIHRHGGRLWAEAAVERGATIYFTLGDRASR